MPPTPFGAPPNHPSQNLGGKSGGGNQSSIRSALLSPPHTTLPAAKFGWKKTRKGGGFKSTIFYFHLEPKGEMIPILTNAHIFQMGWVFETTWASRTWMVQNLEVKSPGRPLLTLALRVSIERCTLAVGWNVVGNGLWPVALLFGKEKNIWI